MRYQFYPSEKLQEKIEEEVKEKGVSASLVITEKLEIAFGIANKFEDDMGFLDIIELIQKEVENYVRLWRENPIPNKREFTLYSASKTFKNISMTDGINLSSLKPRIGKAFRSLVDQGKIRQVSPCTINGKQKRSHNAAVYIINID